VYRAAT